MSTRARLAEVARKRAAYQPVGLTLASEPGVYANRNAIIVEIGRIRPNPRNPRTSFPAEALEELAESIREHGLYNPLTVRREGEHYVIVAGDRRYRAALQVGLTELPCIVVDITADEAYVASLIENLQREDLQPHEEAEALGYLVNERGMGVREVARLIHKSVFFVSTKVRVAQDPELLAAVRAGLPMTAAQQLVAVREPERRQEIIARFLRGEVKVHTLPRLLRPEASSTPRRPDESAPADERPAEPPEPQDGRSSTEEERVEPAPGASAAPGVLYEITPPPPAAPAPPPAIAPVPEPPAAESPAAERLARLVAEFAAHSQRLRAQVERALAEGGALAPAERERLGAELDAWRALLRRLPAG